MMTTIPVTVLLGLALLAVLSPTVMGGCQRYWSGTAPICGHAQCNGCTEIRRDDYGNGGKCVTGSKVLCQCCGPNYPDQNECKPTQTDSKCYGTVLVCRNIFKNASPPFVDTVCSTYACGVCLGIGLGAEDLLSRKDNGTIKLFTKYGQDIDDFDSQIAPTDVTKFSIDLKEGNVL